MRVFLAVVVCSILLSLAFGQSLDQFASTEDFSITGVGMGSALLTILLASIIGEVGWKDCYKSRECPLRPCVRPNR